MPASTAITTHINLLSARDLADTVLATDANDFPEAVRENLAILHRVDVVSHAISVLNNSASEKDHSRAHDLWLAMRFFHMARA